MFINKQKAKRVNSPALMYNYLMLVVKCSIYQTIEFAKQQAWFMAWYHMELGIATWHGLAWHDEALCCRA